MAAQGKKMSNQQNQQPLWAQPPAGTAPLAATQDTNALARPIFNPQDLWPRSFEEVQRLADLLSKSGMVPDYLQKKPENVFYIIMSGLELGVSPIVACREIYMVNGRPGASSLLKIALCRQSAVCAEFTLVETNNKRCVYRARRKGDPAPTTMEFTWDDAISAGLAGRDMYKKWPALMLRRRCGGQLADELFPDIVKGLETLEEEPKDMGNLERVMPSPIIAKAPRAEAQTEGDTESAEGGEAPPPVADGDIPEVEKFFIRVDEVDSLDTLDALVIEANAKRKLMSDNDRKALREAIQGKREFLQAVEGSGQ